MGVIGNLGSVMYDIICKDGTDPATKSAQKNMLAVGAAMTGVGVSAKLMVDSVNTSFQSFDRSMTAVKALGAVTPAEFEKMKYACIDMSTQVPISADDVSAAMYKMVSVGYDFDTMMATIPEATKLAVGGNMELADATDAVINVFGAYGPTVYSAADVTNVLAKAVGVGKWELGDFVTEIMKNIGAAASLGISFEDLAAANVLLQNKFTNAEEAGTAMKTMLLRLVDPKVQKDLEDLGVNVKDNNGNFVGLKSVLDQLKGALDNSGGASSKLAQDFAGLGIKVFDSSGKFRGMHTIVNDLNEVYGRTGKLTPELKDKFEALGFKINEKTGAITLSKKAMSEYDSILSSTGGNVDKMSKLQEIFGTEGLRAALALLDEKDKLAGMSSEMNDATFKEQAFNTVVESTTGKLDIANNRMEAAKIKLGEGMAPATLLAADAMSGLASILIDLPEPLQAIAGTALKAGEAFMYLGPALMGLAALKGLGIASMFTNLAGTLGGLVTVVKGISFAGAIGGFGSFGAAIAGVKASAIASIGAALTGLGPAASMAVAALVLIAPVLIGLALGLAVVYAMKELGILDWISEQGANCGQALKTLGADVGKAAKDFGAATAEIISKKGFLDWVKEEGAACGQWLKDLSNSWAVTASEVDKDVTVIEDAQGRLHIVTKKDLGGTANETKTKTKEISDSYKGLGDDLNFNTGGIVKVLDTFALAGGEKFATFANYIKRFYTGEAAPQVEDGTYKILTQASLFIKGVGKIKDNIIPILGATLAEGVQFGKDFVGTLTGTRVKTDEEATKTAEGLVKIGGPFPEVVGGLIANAAYLVSQVSPGIASVGKSALGVVADILTANIPSTLGGAITGTYSIIQAPINGIYQSVAGMAGGAFRVLKDQWGVDIPAAFGTVTTSFQTLQTGVQNAFTNLFNGISSFIGTMAQGFISAGYNIIMYLIQGLQSGIGAIKGAFGNIFAELAKFIPHSPAEVGPFAVYPNFGGYLSEGMTAAIPEVEAATANTMAVAASTIQASAQPAGMAGGAVTNTIDNSLSINSINASSDYNIEKIYADISTVQAQRSKQKGYRSLA